MLNYSTGTVFLYYVQFAVFATYRENGRGGQGKAPHRCVAAPREKISKGG